MDQQYSPWIHQSCIIANKEKNEMFFHKEAFSISSLRDDVRRKTFYKALRKVSHFGNKQTQLWLNQPNHTLPKDFAFKVLRTGFSSAYLSCFIYHSLSQLRSPLPFPQEKFFTISIVVVEDAFLHLR